jgi:hypothetical protein
MASRDYLCDECAYRFRTPPSEVRDSPFVMCPACGSGFVSLAIERRTGPVVMRAGEPARAGDWWFAVHKPRAS